MAKDIRGSSEHCWEDRHGKCDGNDCYCECHVSPERQSLHWKLSQLAKSAAPDSQRLQVLIQLTAELARELRK